eukprot:6648699-Prorocentrum_lima.AAC.1
MEAQAFAFKSVLGAVGDPHIMNLAGLQGKHLHEVAGGAWQMPRTELPMRGDGSADRCGEMLILIVCAITGAVSVWFEFSTDAGAIQHRSEHSDCRAGGREIRLPPLHSDVLGK